MLSECPAYGGHIVPAAGHHVEDAVRQAGPLGQDRQGQGRQGRVLGRLEDTGAAGRQGRRHLRTDYFLKFLQKIHLCDLQKDAADSLV